MDVLHLGKPVPYYDQNNPDWAPSLNLGYHNSCSISRITTRSRYEHLRSRVEQKQSMREEVDCVQQDDGMDEEPRNDQEPVDSSVVSAGCQTDLTLPDLNELEAALANLKDLETALLSAKNKLKPPRHN